MILSKNYVMIYTALQDRAIYAPVAQLDRAFDYGSKGREFESSPARQTKKDTLEGILFFGLSAENTEHFAKGKMVR